MATNRRQQLAVPLDVQVSRLRHTGPPVETSAYPCGPARFDVQRSVANHPGVSLIQGIDLQGGQRHSRVRLARVALLDADDAGEQRRQAMGVQQRLGGAHIPVGDGNVLAAVLADGSAHRLDTRHRWLVGQRQRGVGSQIALAQQVLIQIEALGQGRQAMLD